MSHPIRAYVVGPAADFAEIYRAADALERAGFTVDTPTYPLTDANADELARIAEYDLSAALDADAVVTLPGSDDLAEVITAGAVGIPVVTLADALAARRRLVAAYTGPARGLSAYLALRAFGDLDRVEAEGVLALWAHRAMLDEPARAAVLACFGGAR